MHKKFNQVENILYSSPCWTFVVIITQAILRVAFTRRFQLILNGHAHHEGVASVASLALAIVAANGVDADGVHPASIAHALIDIYKMDTNC